MGLVVSDSQHDHDEPLAAIAVAGGPADEVEGAGAVKLEDGVAIGVALDGAGHVARLVGGLRHQQNRVFPWLVLEHCIANQTHQTPPTSTQIHGRREM